VTSIYTVPVSGGAEQRLVSGAQYGWGLAWTPDGREIVFGRAGWLANAGWLWKIASRGGEPERLQFGQEGVEPSIRENRLVYARQVVNINIWRKELNASLSAGPSDRFIHSTRMESGPQFSPDGSRIAFESTRSGAYEVWMCRSDGSDVVQLTHFNVVSGTPRWSPDGRQIVFDSSVPGNTDIFVVDAQGGVPHQLTIEPSSESVPSWSRDGHWIYFASDRTGRYEVWKTALTGGSAVQVTHQGGFAAIESPNGRFLYYAKSQTLPGLWRIPTEGGEEVEIISSLEAGHWGYWAVVENGIYYLDTTAKPAIAFFDVNTRRATRIFDLENRPAKEAPGLAVSPDKGTILYTQLDSLSRDIVPSCRQPALPTTSEVSIQSNRETKRIVLKRMKHYSSVFLRLALGISFLSAVADRFGLWGSFGQPNVSWGDFSHFVAYTGKLNWFMPSAAIPALAWLATCAETLLGVALILGVFTRVAAFLAVGSCFYLLSR
jgi:Tol biopolymer transport system component/uncharacterized membrane protein YphA (DoxX/SURF4 family)